MGPVAAVGMLKNSGAKSNDNAKHTAIVNAVSPVRPPSSTPTALSM